MGTGPGQHKCLHYGKQGLKLNRRRLQKSGPWKPGKRTITKPAKLTRKMKRLKRG